MHMRDEVAFKDVMKCFSLYLEGIFNSTELFQLIGDLLTAPSTT